MKAEELSVESKRLIKNVKTHLSVLTSVQVIHILY